MSDDELDDVAKPSPRADAAAMHTALSGNSEEARHYLRKQSRLADLQIDTLEKQDEFETSHLRWRRFNDQMKGAMQIMLVLIGALIVFGIGAAVWSAAHDDGVVIEAFNVPPDMQQRGLTGSVVSSMLLDKLTALQANIDSARAPSSYASKGDDIKVLIPDTGISISEAYRYLSNWLGHQTHISGDVYRSAKGITVVVRTSGNPGASFDGNEDKLNDLMEHAAEAVYRQTQPFRYAVHLLNYGRYSEADTVLSDLVANGPAMEKPWAYAVWMYSAIAKGDLSTAIARAHTAAKLDPNNLLAQVNVSQVEALAGHDEQELRYDYLAKAAYAAGGGEQVRPAARTSMLHSADSNIAEETGAYREAIAVYDTQLAEPDFNGSHWSVVYLKASYLALMHDVAASRNTLGGYTDAGLLVRAAIGAGYNGTNMEFPQFDQLSELGDWASARKDIEQLPTSPNAKTVGAIHVIVPHIAFAQAKTGDFKSARMEIEKTPLDCYACVRVRAQIAAMQRDWNGSAQWFARAVTLAPSIPFAYTEWGQMLMRKGDLDGAVAKFETAHAKGPRFADPLEMWGEVLIAKNRSDLAVAKFEDANRYAPMWKRLHQKWGEALSYLGRKDEAAKQFAIARSLDG